ncbi:MAG: DUF58 domain-containing protein [Paenibacillaceae bacterium]
MNDFYPRIELQDIPAPQRELFGIKKRAWLVLSCFIVTLSFLLFQGGKLSFMVFTIVSILCIYLGLGQWSGIRKSKGVRTLVASGHESIMEAGSTLGVKIKLNIPGFWPVPYVLIKDHLQRHNGGEQVFEASLIPDWKRNGTMEYRTPPLRRGVYTFTNTDCSTEDIFGFFEHKGTLALEHSFSVLPLRTTIREWKKLQQMLKGMHHHSSTARAMRETTQINGAREYNYGDRLSRIHWNATAKTGTLKSKEFERESLPKTIVILDRAKHHYANQEQFELAVSITASLIEFGTKRDLAFGLLSTGANSVYFEPKYGQSQHMQILNHLVVVEADGEFSLDQVLKERTKSLLPGTFVAIISPQIGEFMFSALAWINQRQMSPCHIWVRDEKAVKQADKQAEWLKQLRIKGYLGYDVPSLDELSQVLGGRG